MARTNPQPTRRPGVLQKGGSEVGARRSDGTRTTETTILRNGVRDADHNGATPGYFEGKPFTPPVPATED